MRTSKPRLIQLLVALGGDVALIVTMATPSSALTSHTTTVLDGSFIDPVESDRVFPLGVGTPQCSDSEDNDADGATDASDPECDAGGVGQPESADDSECEDGFQAQGAAPTMSFEDNGAGTLSGFVVDLPAAEVCTTREIFGSPTTVCFLVDIDVDSDSASGTVTDTGVGTGEITAGPFAFTVSVGECDHHPATGFDPDGCQVTFSNVSFSTTNTNGVSYAESGGVGTSTLATQIPSGPSIPNSACGGVIFVVDYSNELNAEFGLPGAVDVVLVGSTVPDLSSVN